MKAVILAGGRGSRLAPYTSILPKPLMPVGGVPILEIILWQLHHFGITEVTLASGYLSELIQAYLMRSKISQRIRIHHHTESQPLGTAGAIKQIKGLDEPFLVMNGDILTSLNYAAAIKHHQDSKAALTIAITKKIVRLELGVLLLDDKSHVVGYQEKPVKEFPASTGIYIYDPRVLNHIESDTYLDLPTLVLRLIEAGEIVAGYQTDAFWLDIGNKDDFERASAEFEARKSQMNIDEWIASEPAS